MVDRFLGGGYHGDVYAVRDGNSLSALKIMRDGQEQAPLLEQRFREQGALFRRLKHRNLVHILETGVAQGGLCWTRMELLLGGTLREEIAQNRSIALPAAVRYLRHAFAGAHELHNFGIIHRDLKPENMMLLRIPGQPPLLKLVDFNTAMFQQEDQPRSSAGGSGTPAYMAPEQLRSQGTRIGPATDVYAICLVGWEMLVGERPLLLATTTPAALLGQLASDQVPSLRTFGVPHEIADVIAKGLAQSPDDRFPTAACAADALVEAQRFYHGRSGRSRADLATRDGRRGSQAIVTPRQSVPIALLQASIPVDEEPASLGRSTVPGAPADEILARERQGPEEKPDPNAPLPSAVPCVLATLGKTTQPITVAESACEGAPPSPGTSPPITGFRWDNVLQASPGEGKRRSSTDDFATLQDVLPTALSSLSADPTSTPEPLPDLIVKPVELPAMDVVALPSSFAPVQPRVPATPIVGAPPSAPRVPPRPRPGVKPPLTAIQVLAFGVFMLGLALAALVVWIAHGPRHIRYGPPWTPDGERASNPPGQVGR